MRPPGHAFWRPHGALGVRHWNDTVDDKPLQFVLFRATRPTTQQECHRLAPVAGEEMALKLRVVTRRQRE